MTGKRTTKKHTNTRNCIFYVLCVFRCKQNEKRETMWLSTQTNESTWTKNREDEKQRTNERKGNNGNTVYLNGIKINSVASHTYTDTHTDTQFHVLSSIYQKMCNVCGMHLCSTWCVWLALCPPRKKGTHTQQKPILIGTSARKTKHTNNEHTKYIYFNNKHLNPFGI